jgi:tetratricopeptide (TPR) repeat protein
VGAIAAFWAITLVSFGVVTTWLLHWVLLGLLANRCAPDRDAPSRAGDPGMGDRDHGASGTAHAPARLVGAAFALALLAQVPLLAAEAYARRAEVLAAAEHPGSSVAARRAVTLNPLEPGYRIGLARILVGETAGAMQPAGDPLFPPSRQERLVEALAQADSAVVGAPRDAYVWLAAAEIRRAVGALTGDAAVFDRAEAAFRAALSLDPRLAEAESGWGLAAFLRGDAPAAVRHYEAALALDESDALTYARLGEALLVLARGDEAAEAFARAVGNDPALVAAWVGHGRALCRVGKRDEAIGKLERALELAPGDVAAEKALAECRAEVP